LLLALLVTFGPLPARAATITVNETSDSSGGRGCTLRDAIATANAQGGSATGGCAVGSAGPNTILFGLIGSAKIKLLTDSELMISSDVTIQGPGPSALTIDGNGATRVLEVSAGTTTISDLTIENGNSGSGNGGGILVDVGATLNATNCVVSSNKAGSSGTGSFFAGGGIDNLGTLNLTNCTISGNKVGFAMGPNSFGGGIENEGTATLTKCTISSNKSLTSDGGGIRNFEGTLTVTNSTISGNTAAGNGGGLEDDTTATTTVYGSTINGNSANAATGHGGGIDKNGNALNVTNSTISSNTAKGAGGGLYYENTATVALLNCTVAKNKAPTGFGGGVVSGAGGVTLGNTIIAFSGATGGDCVGSLSGINNDNNLIDDSSNDCGLVNGTNGSGNLIGATNPELLPLAKNGGPTLTMALCTGSGTPKTACTAASSAWHAGSTTICAGAPVNNSDQRGYLRNTPASCDIGAYESPQ
jgi:hypothetical protein